MYWTTFWIFTLLAMVSAATQSRDYLPRPPARTYVYNAPPPSTMVALRRIIQGHLDRFQQADQAHFSRRSQLQQAKSDVGAEKRPQVMQLWLVPAGSAGSASDNVLEYALPPNTPTPKNYARNFLPEGRDVVPGSSYIPLRLLVIKR